MTAKVTNIHSTSAAFVESTDVDHIKLGYTGRRLQYAIRLGIVPTPEKLRQLLDEQAPEKTQKRA